MDIINGLNTLIKTVSTDKKAAKWFVVIIVFALVAGLSAAFFYINKPKKTAAASGQCDYLIEQNRQLVNSLLDIKSNLKTLLPEEEGAASPTSLNISVDHSDLSYTIMGERLISYTYSGSPEFTADTIPKTKQQYQQAIYKIIGKIDSTLIKNRLDSLRKADLEKRKRN